VLDLGCGAGLDSILAARRGRIQMADILLEDGVTPQEVARKGTWSD
jgi:hypothetical protein